MKKIVNTLLGNRKDIIELIKGITFIFMLFVAWELVKFLIINIAV